MRKAAFKLSFIALLLMAEGVFSSFGRAIASNTSTGPARRNFIEEWEKVSSEEVKIARMSKEQILAEVHKLLEAQKALNSWEAKYQVTSRQAEQENISVPEIIMTSQVHIISSDAKWFYESKQGTEDKTAKETWAVNKRIISDGNVVSIVWPDRNEAMVQSKDQYKGTFDTERIVDFMPCLRTESCLPRRPDFPVVFEILDASDTQLLPWYARVDEQTCYILERTITLQQPVFRNEKELVEWKRGNPEQAEAWSRAARYGVVFNIYPQGKPGGGDTLEIEMKFRLAIAPKLDFAIVCWAYGHGSRSGAYQGFIFPYREIKYGDFRKVSKDLFIPHQMVYASYRIGRHGQRHIANETRLTVEEFAVNKRYQSKLFEFDFPEGCNVVDAEKGIIYTAGDSKGKIDDLVAAAKAREAFYKNLSQAQAPALEPSEWLNTAPIILAEQKGRPIILHFWSLGCAPCIYELPRLQKQYGRTIESSSKPLFISIHPFVDGKNLSQLKKVIEKHGITFPVMMDSECTGKPFWGKTFKKYMIMGIPNEITIDEIGHVSKIPEGYVSTDSMWMKNQPK